MMSPDVVAAQAWTAAQAGRDSVVHGLHHRALVATVSHLPMPLRRAFSRQLLARVNAEVR